jgi:ribosomal protein S18 acetylase RimI-like enzyme
MSTLKLSPISYTDRSQLAALMDEEELCWMSDLKWDYAPVRRILSSFIEQKRLPGYVASDDRRALGYAYFLAHHSKGIIGTLYASKLASNQEVADEILALAIECLKEAQGIRRIEAQIMPFNNLNLTAGFTRRGFRCYPRYYLELDLQNYSRSGNCSTAEKIVPWDPAFLSLAAQVTFNSYSNQPDSQLCEDYCTIEGCESYLRSLLENPGCGLFMAEASFVGLDSRGAACGFLFSSRISNTSGMIPQVAILPSHQGHGLGNALMHYCLSYFKAQGYHTVSLTVTKQNKRAFEWYQRMGFKIQKEFGAFVWER